VWPRF